MLRRSVTDRKIAGVCGGLGRYYNIDPTIVRVLFVVLFFNPYLLSAVAYAVMMFAVPEESTEQSG
ncbi:MAG TPA: PspC domain-containing protein [Bacteroidetes bacterium]|nr:PspC domain-containing protein [Bacteroidota bacterium]